MSESNTPPNPPATPPSADQAIRDVVEAMRTEAKDRRERAATLQRNADRDAKMATDLIAMAIAVEAAADRIEESTR